MSKSAASGLQDRLIIIDIEDRNQEPIAGAQVIFYLDDLQIGGIETGENGRGTFLISPTTATIKVEARYDKCSEFVTLGSDVDMWKFKLPIDVGTHVVVLVHGINTRAPWISVLSGTLQNANLVAAPAGYGVWGVVRFLLPFDRLRRQAARRVVTKIRTAKVLHNPEKLSVIAHSFGSYLIARTLAEEFDIKWHRVIFCGGVASERFPLEQYLSRFDSPILNEIGTQDYWPALAEAITWGYGSVGSFGFNSPAVTERWHKGFTHSDFLTANFCTKFWIPFLEKGEIIKGNEPEPLPRMMRILARLPLNWIILIIFIVLAGWLVRRLFALLF